MTERPKMFTPAVSIIHGARVPFEPARLDRQWMAELQSRLQSRGFPSVSLFRWSGGYLRSFLPYAALRYARELMRLWTECLAAPEGPRPLAIYAKSNGGFVAEAALRLLHQEQAQLEIDILLRVGTPDDR